MNKENDTRSVDKLQDALGMIKEEYIEEAARPESSRGKKPMRIAGIVAAAAVVIILVSVAVILPGTKNNSSQQAEVNMDMEAAEAYQDEKEAGADMYQAEAAAEAPAYQADAAAEAPAYQEDVAEEAPAYQAEEAGASPAEAADAPYDMAAEGGAAVAFHMEAEVKDPFEQEGGLIINNASALDQLLADYIPNDEALTDALLERYDTAFFEDHNLALSFIELSSGSYEMKYLSTDETGTKAVQHYKVYRPDEEGMLITADMAPWMLLSEVSKDVTEVAAVED